MKHRKDEQEAKPHPKLMRIAMRVISEERELLKRLAEK
jgi:hypothetical protein